MMPRLTIITVNFNNKDGFIKTANSIVAQTFGDYEWIIIDGGSTDGSAEVIRQYAGKSSKIAYWCSERDGGVYFGMNKGIARASMEYCYFLNSGDYLYGPTTLEEIFEAGFDEDIVYGNMLRKTRGGYAVHRYGDVIRPPDLIYGSIQHQNMLFRTETLRGKNGYRTDYRIAADWVFYLEAICREKASYRHIPVVFAMIEAGGMSDSAKYWSVLKAERRRAVREIFPLARRVMYIFSMASLKSKIHKIAWRLNKLAGGRGTA